MKIVVLFTSEKARKVLSSEWDNIRLQSVIRRNRAIEYIKGKKVIISTQRKWKL